MNYKISKTLIAAACASGLLSQQASAILLDFNSQNHGDLVQNQFVSDGVSSIVVTGGSNFAAFYDTGVSGGADSDLEGPNEFGVGSWEGGNLAFDSLGNELDIYSGKVMIIQTGTVTAAQQAAGNVTPNDFASGGTITFNFSTAISAFQLDWIDLDEGNEDEYSFTFTDSSNGLSATLDFDLITTAGNAVSDPTVSWSLDPFDPNGEDPGDDYANRFPEITIADIVADTGVAITQIDTLTVNFGGSGGFANLNITPVPEPSSYALLFGIFVSAVVVTRRHRS